MTFRMRNTDVNRTSKVRRAGALMDDEISNLDQVKTFELQYSHRCRGQC